jgi:hypothetical protein
MDAATIRAVAELVRKRARNGADHGDGMARLGARRALTQLADDLDVTARQFERPRRGGPPA